MVSEMKKEYSVILFVLLLLNVFLCLLLFWQVYEKKRLAGIINQTGVLLKQKSIQNESNWRNSILITPNLMRDELSAQKLLDKVCSCPGIVVFIPVNICGVCETEQLKVLGTYLDAISNVSIVCPQYKVRDLSIAYSNSSNMRVFGYDYERVQSQILQQCDSMIVMCSSGGMSIDGVIVADKSAPEWMHFFYEQYLNIM